MIRLRTLGPVEVTVDGGPAPPELLWRKHLALLVYLVLSPRGTRSRDHLVGLLWPDKAESAARHSLNEALRVIRRSVGDQAVETRVDQVLFHPGQVTCDARELDRLAEAGDVEGAAGLVTGEFLEGFTVPGAVGFEDWLAAERLRVGRSAIGVLVQSARRALDRGDTLEAETLASRARRLDPLSESAVAVMLHTLALSGDRGRALALAEEYRTGLLEVVGADPAPELERLVARIRQGTHAAAAARLAPEAMARTESSRRRAPLVGRTESLAQVMDLWSRVVRRSEPAIALVLAHRGTGKTRFIEEVAARARLDGALVLPVRAIPGDERADEAAILAAAGSGLLEAPGLAGAPAEALAAFAGRLLAWQERFPQLRSASEGTGLGEALGQIIRVVADEVPVLVAVDDAEYLDQASLHGVSSLARAGGDRPVLVLMSADPEAGRPIDGLRSRIGPDGSLAGLVARLDLLDRDDLQELIRWGLPDYEPEAVERLGRRLTADSAGLPLLAVELLSAVAGGMELEEGGSWPAPFRTLDHTLPGDLPEPVVAAIRVGFGRLGSDARTVLAALSVMDPRAAPEALALATGLDEPAVVAALDELEWSRWVVSEVRGYACTARIVRDVIARDMLTPGQRKRIQARLGRGDQAVPTPRATGSAASPQGGGGTS